MSCIRDHATASSPVRIDDRALKQPGQKDALARVLETSEVMMKWPSWPFLHKAWLARAAGSLLLALAMSISVADLFVPLFWQRRLLVRLGFILLATFVQALLIFPAVLRFTTSPFRAVSLTQRFLRLLFGLLLAGLTVIVIAAAARHSLQVAPNQDVLSRHGPHNLGADQLALILEETLLLYVCLLFLAIALWPQEYRPAISQQRAWHRGVLVLALLGLLCYGSYALRRPEGGFNYRIYNYFSGLYWQGQNPYLAPHVTITDVNESFRKPEYLDYSGAQLLIYNACYYMTNHLGLDGFVLYSLLFLLFSLLLAYRLAASKVLNWEEYILFAILVLSPYLWYTLLFGVYEDKAFYILLPFVVLYSRFKSLKATGLLLGLTTGLIGIAAALFPLVALSILNEPDQGRAAKFRTLIVTIAWMLVGGILAFLPFFPESLLGWQRRAILESGHPYWFSIWNLAGSLYFPNLNKWTILLACLVVYALFAVGRLEFKTALLLVLSFFFTFSVTMSVQRILPFVIVLVIGFRHSLPRLVYCLSVFGLLGAFLILDESRSFLRTYPATLATAQAKSLIMLSPIVLGYGMVILDNLQGFGNSQEHLARWPV